MAQPARPRATYADVLAAPSHMVAEILGGELHLSPHPAIPHAAALTALGGVLGPPFKRGRGGPGGWLQLNKPELHLGEDIVVPDRCGWRRERLPALPNAAFVTLAPDWVCEVLSPSTAKLDRSEKLRIYARERVAHVWLIDPTLRTLEVLALDGESWRLLAVHHDDARVRAQPFEVFELDLSVLWADVTPA
jgi:Uma2 family endonuclease